MNTTSPMVEAVNRLIANRLAAGGGIFLPGVGSLVVERRAARRISRRRIEPPCRRVAFQSAEQGTSIVKEIAAAAQCDETRAGEIYNRWYDQVSADGTLTIASVGTLRDKSFVMQPAFDKLLNPQGHAPVRIKSGVDWVVWVGVVAIVATLGFGYYLYTTGFFSQASFSRPVAVQPQPSQPVAQPVETTSEASATPAEPQPTAPETQPSATAAQPAPASQPAAPASALAGTIEAPARMTPGSYYVVSGVFSTTEYATAALQHAASKGIICGVYRFGDKTLITPFTSTDRAACERFIEQHSELTEGMWIHQAKN